MGTYAVYEVWAGVLIAQADKNNPFVKRVLSSCEGVEKDGLLFESISMHGESIGIGVRIEQLSWQAQIGGANWYDTTIANSASKTLKRVEETFKKLGIALIVPPRLYHHIDLGG